MALHEFKRPTLKAKLGLVGKPPKAKKPRKAKRSALKTKKK